MGATHTFYFTVKPISCTPYRGSIWGLGYTATVYLPVEHVIIIGTDEAGTTL